MAIYGNIEDVSNVDVLIEELVREKADEQEQRHGGRHNAESSEEVPVKAGEQICELATVGAVRRTASVSVNAESESTVVAPKKSRREKKDMYAWQTMLQSKLQSRRKRKIKSIAVEKKESVLQREEYMDGREKRELKKKKKQTAKLQLLSALFKKLM